MPSRKGGALRSGGLALAATLTVASAGCVEPADDVSLERSFAPAPDTAAPRTTLDTTPDVWDHKNVLPDGLYRVRVAAASCDVNEAYRASRDVLLFRSRRGQPPSIDVPLPWRSEADGGDEGVPKRQALSLTQQIPQLLASTGSRCADSSDFDLVDIEEVTPTLLHVSFQRMTLGCRDTSSPCEVSATFELVQRSCDPACEPTRVVRVVTASGLDARCTCADPP